VQLAIFILKLYVVAGPETKPEKNPRSLSLERMMTSNFFDQQLLVAATRN